MMKKTRGMAMVVALATCGMLVCGCAAGGKETKEIVSSDVKEEATEQEKEEPESEEQKADKKGTEIEEQVLLDKDGVKITAKEYIEGGIFGDAVKILIENNSDQVYTVGCDALIVNDYMIDDLFACEVAAGKKANQEIGLYSYELEEAGIDSVGKIEIYFNAFDSNYNMVFDGEYAEIQTSNYENLDTTIDEEGLELFNEKGIRIVGKTVDEDSFWGAAMLLYIENTSDKDVCISIENMSINGFMIDPFYATNVYAGKKKFGEVSVFETDLEANGIESIDEVELQFSAFDLKSFNTVFKSGPIAFSAE